MSAGPVGVGLGGLPSSALPALIKVQLVGVDLAAFGQAGASAEVVARGDPGGDKASLVFSKGGQTLSLPPEIARAFVPSGSGSAQVAVEFLGRAPDGSVAVALRRAPQAGSPGLPAALPAMAEPRSASPFSEAGSLLSRLDAGAAALDAPAGWASLVKELAGAPAHPREAAAAFARALGSLPASLGVGFERALARAAGMGPELAAQALGGLSRFPQASAPAPAAGLAAGSIASLAPASHLMAQQAVAHREQQMQWSGMAWEGAPAWLAWGAAGSQTDQARETRERCAAGSDPCLAWLRARVEPRGLGPIDLWAALLGSGRCSARVRAEPRSAAALELARRRWVAELGAARVDLSISAEEVS